MPSNVTGLPPEFVKRFKEALAPVCVTRDERRLLLIEAFGTGPTSEAIQRIDCDLTAPLFAVDCCVKLSSEPISDRTHPLAAILRVVGERRGAEVVRELDALIEFCNGLRAAPNSSRATPIRQLLEREYLERLRLEELINTDKYTRLAGSTRFALSPSHALKTVVARPEFEHLAQRNASADAKPARKFEDAVPELFAIRRAAVLGDPGAGKSTTLWRLARQMVDAALGEPSRPIPLLVKLGDWTIADQSLSAFIASQMGDLGAHLDALLAEGKAALLLDGLNEIPVAQRKMKVSQVAAFLRADPQRDLIAIVTCREQDYLGQDLRLDRVTILPLNPTRILEFAQAYLGWDEGESFFWKLASDLKREWEIWRFAGAGLDMFITHRWKPGSLVKLARNPYMLAMLVQVYLKHRRLPPNRAGLFEEFVEVLLLREHLASRDSGTAALTISEGGADILIGLARMAFSMQRSAILNQKQSDNVEDTTAATSIALDAARHHLADTQLWLAASASFIILGETVRFTHQLLQEYFAARQMEVEIRAGRLRAVELWPPPRWWERTGWEETAVLLAGMNSVDCSPILRWLADANPEVATRCINHAGATTPDTTLLELRARWLPRLTDLKRDPEPMARAAVGRALGLLTLSTGETIDNRPGVGAVVRADRDRVPTPVIDWVFIAGGNFIYQNETREVGSFRIARYPVTYGQFQAFLDSSDGWSDQGWWRGLSDVSKDRTQPDAPWFKYWNHPCVDVSWYDAVAFCRWLSLRLGHDVSLPSEHQWERTARGTKGREYAYPGQYDPAKANTHRSIGLTSAVGIYPNGATPQPEGVLDLTGNVWEWCLNEYEKPDEAGLTGNAIRALRGGAWDYYPYGARAAYRTGYDPSSRYSDLSFRVVCAPV